MAVFQKAVTRAFIAADHQPMTAGHVRRYAYPRAPATRARTTGASAGRSRASAVVLSVVARPDAPSYGRRLRRLDLSYRSNRLGLYFAEPLPSALPQAPCRHDTPIT